MFSPRQLTQYHAIPCLHVAVDRTVLDVQKRDQLRTEPASEGQIELMQIGLSWEFGFGGPYYIAPWVLSAGIGCVQKGLWRCQGVSWTQSLRSPVEPEVIVAHIPDAESSGLFDF